MEQKANGTLCLLLFDPSSAPGEMRRALSQDTAAAMIRRMRKFPGALKHRQYQVVAVEGVLTHEEKQVMWTYLFKIRLYSGYVWNLLMACGLPSIWVMFCSYHTLHIG